VAHLRCRRSAAHLSEGVPLSTARSSTDSICRSSAVAACCTQTTMCLCRFGNYDRGHCTLGWR
jgi:hypothetical protein